MEMISTMSPALSSSSRVFSGGKSNKARAIFLADWAATGAAAAGAGLYQNKKLICEN